MSKNKITSNDFMRLMEEEAASNQHIAFAPSTDFKVKPIMSQSEAKPEPLHKPIMSQSEAKPEPLVRAKTKVKPLHEPQPEPLHKPIMSQSEAKPEPLHSFDSLVGLQKNILLFIFESCLSSGSKVSKALASSNLAIGLGSTVAAVRKAIQRLEQKQYIVRSQFKDGRGGWTKYELPHSVYSELLTSRTRANHEPIMSQSGAKVSTQPEPQPEPTVPYSSSMNLNINTNTTEIPGNLRRFGISAVNLQSLIVSGKATQDVVERSLAALSFDVEGGKTGNLANILFGVLNSGREYISQKYSEALQAELDLELSRIVGAQENQKLIAESKLKLKFQEYLQTNPEFLDSVKERHKGYITNQDLLEKMALEEFKTLEVKV